MSSGASDEALAALAEKLTGKHEHTWEYVETLVHVEGQGKCYHYRCKGRGCKATQGINMTHLNEHHKEIPL